MSKELIESLRYLANCPPYSGAADIMLRAADALEAKAAPVGVPVYQLQCREIGEGDWCPADLRHYTYCQRAPEMDTRIVEVQQAGTAYQRQSVVMPERQDAEDLWHPVMKDRAIGWNACLDEFARLNGDSHE